MPTSSETDHVDLESYFDRPEVKAKYLAQKAIQVPEFSPLPDDAVGARLRARAPEVRHPLLNRMLFIHGRHIGE